MHYIYISQTERSLQERVKKYKRDIFKYMFKTVETGSAWKKKWEEVHNALWGDE